MSKSQSGLNTWDVASLVIGIVVGTAIFKTPPAVFGSVASPIHGLLIWLAGGILALCGALCYCELATQFPKHGAEYTYLSEAFGRRVGFLFAWMQICVILTGSIGAMAYVFADYTHVLLPSLRLNEATIACFAVLILTVTHLRGLQTGKTIQNVLSLGKVIALVIILLAGFFATPNPNLLQAIPGETSSASGLGLALVFVLYAYGGWNDVATVTPEVKNYQREVPRALLYSLGFITLLYLAINLAYLNSLGMMGLRDSSAPAADVAQRFAGGSAGRLVSAVVMLSALGAIHGMLFSACRLLSAVGEDYQLFTSWNQWSDKQVPVWSMISLTIISLALILIVGTENGQRLVETYTELCGFDRPDWEFYNGGFNTLVAATAPIFWTFFALSGIAIFVLRMTKPNQSRPFRVPLYPVVPIIFIGSCFYMLYSSMQYAGKLTLLMLPVLLVGIILSFSTSSRATENS